MRCKVLLSLSIPHKGGGLRWPLYCCISRLPLSLLPSNIEARALLKASFRHAPAVIFTCRCPTCFRRTPAAIFSCRRPTTLLMPRSAAIFFCPMPRPPPHLRHLLTLPCCCFSNLAAAAAIFCYCRIAVGWCNFMPLTHPCSTIFSLLLLLPNISQGEFSFTSVTLTIFHFWKKIISHLI
jgi:hypothetical protein